jgi:hypothetical protein
MIASHTSRPDARHVRFSQPPADGFFAVNQRPRDAIAQSGTDSANTASKAAEHRRTPKAKAIRPVLKTGLIC